MSALRFPRHHRHPIALAALASMGLAAHAQTVPPVARAATAVITNPGRLIPVQTDAQRQAALAAGVTVNQLSDTQMLLTQSTLRATVNWQSFNVGSGAQVEFRQPDRGSTLNRIADERPSVILGRIKANGEVLLENQNGVIFGPTARVETGRFVATALRVDDAAFSKGLRGITDASPVFSAASPNGYVSIERGAEIRTAAGGDVLVFAPRVVNAGRIETPDGQTVLGAGGTVYLTSSADATQRGLIVRIQPIAGGDGVTPLNVVTQVESGSYSTLNGETVADGTAGAIQRINAIVAERGSINLVALAIQQNGVLQATTAVKGQNGVIRLQSQSQLNTAAVDSFSVNGQGVDLPQVSGLGQVVFGPASRTEVRPETDRSKTQFDSETFNPSVVRVDAERVWIRAGATIAAPAGRIEITTSETPLDSRAFSPSGAVTPRPNDDSRIVVEDGASLDVGGLRDVVLPMSRNQLSLRLFQNELADSPVQRDGALYRQEILFDARNRPAIANVAGAYVTIARSAEELSTVGGSIVMRSDGAVLVDQGAALNVSGGSLRFESGTLKRSLVRQGERWITIDRARADTRYDELGNSADRSKLGQAIFQVDTVPGYVEGKDAGSLEVSARRTWLAPSLSAGVVVGDFQTGRGSLPPPASGSLTLGFTNATTTGSLTLQTVAPARPAAVLADPMKDGAVDTLQAEVQLSTAELQSSGLGSLTANVLGKVRLPEGARLTLAPRGALTLTGGDIDILGEVRVASGRIVLNAPLSAPNGSHGIALGAQARLDASGLWTLDSAAASAADPVAVDGGSIALNAAGSLAAAQGATLDVSAGGRAVAGSTSISTTTGRAGDVALALNVGSTSLQPRPGSFSDWKAAVFGFDFARGGSLSVSGLVALTLGGGQADAYFDDAFFNQRGFGSVSLATFGDVRLRRGLDLNLQLRNYIVDTSLLGATGRFGRIDLVPLASQRAAVSLALTGATAPERAPDGSLAVTGSAISMDSGARIATEAGGSLRLSARSLLAIAGTLQAPAGTISLALQGLRGGSLSAGIYEDNLGFVPNQAVWLTPTARLLAAGTEELAPDSLGRPNGIVYGGGSVSLNAERGYVVAQAGAVIDVSGYSAQALTSSASQVQTVSRPGGSISLSTREGLHLGAMLKAAAADANADGGSLTIDLGLGGRERFTSGPQYDASPRELRLTNDLPAALAAAVTPGVDLPGVLGSGIGVVSNTLLQGAGLSRLTLRADQRIRFDQNMTVAASRSLTLDSAVLAADGPGANLDAEVFITAPHVALGDQRVTARLSGETAPVSSLGDGVVEVRAGLVEVFGDLALQGIKFAGLRSTLDTAGSLSRTDGEVRLIGTLRAGQGRVATGSLSFDGELQFTAGQVYATTMSQFTVQGRRGQDVNGTGSAASLIGVYAPGKGSDSQSPLSAAASLTLDADRVDVSGVVRQPFGAIQVQAARLDLRAGAEVSVSGADEQVPLGTLVNGRRWQYSASGLYVSAGVARSVDPNSNSDIRLLDALPVSKSISLDVGRLGLDVAAKVSAAGGGELLAWEFIPGVGGSTDYLARNGVYAVLPTRRYEFAPYDAEIVSNSGTTPLLVGSQIEVTMSGSALAPGRYTLMPARYALLPGAVVVSLAADQGRAPLTAPLALDSGGIIVTGRLSGVGATDGGTPVSRILIEPRATALARSRIDVTKIGSLLSVNAARLDTTTPTLPVDAGTVSLRLAQAFTLPVKIATVTGPDGTAQPSAQSPLRLQAGRNAGDGVDGVSGRLEIAVRGGTVAIVDNAASPPAGQPADASVLDVRALNASGAGSLLIGGARNADGSVATLSRSVQLLTAAPPEPDPKATTVDLSLPQALTAPEVALIALNDVGMGQGAQIKASGSAGASGSTRWSLDGAGAFLLAGTGADVDVVRGSLQVDRAGRMAFGKDARITSPLTRIDGTGLIDLADTLSIKTANFGINAGRLALLDAANAGLSGSAALTGYTVLKGTLLQDLSQVDRLSFGAAGGVDFYGTHSFTGRKSVTVDAPNLRGLGAAGSVTIDAQEVLLRNTTTTSADTGSVGTGSFVVTAQPALSDSRTGGLTLGSALGGKGSQFLGFGSVSLTSLGDAVFTGIGRLTSQADLTLSSARLTATTGARQGLEAQSGTLNIAAAPAGARTLGEAVGRGAELEFKGSAINQGGLIDAPGALIDFRAGSNGLTLAGGSRTSVAGFELQAGDWAQAGSAGRVRLISDGAVTLAGAVVVSAPGAADAGELAVMAAQGLVDLASSAQLSGGSDSGRTGRVTIDAGRLARDGAATAALDPLADALTRGGFGDSVSLRVRQGDLRLDGGTLQSRNVSLVADGGTITLGGVVDARSPGGGQVRIHASGNVDLNGQVLASSSRTGANGGDITLGSSSGRVRLGAGAVLDAGGDDVADGRIVLRVGRDETRGSVALDIDSALDRARQLTAGEVIVEAVRTYTGFTSLVSGASSGTRLGQNNIQSDAVTFAARSAGVLGTLGLAGDTRASVRSGVEVVASGDFSVANDWNLWRADRAGGQPGLLTLRVAGNLDIAGSLSDGFASAARPDGNTLRAPTEIKPGAAWSMRLVAGADAASADPMATTGSTGRFQLANDKWVRTTAGSIDIAAAGDIRLGTGAANTQQGVVYVAGRPTSQVVSLGAGTSGSNWQVQMTDHGGNLRLRAGGDIAGAPTTQLFGAWFYKAQASSGAREVAWFSAFDAYRQGIASFGGGRIDVVAGGNVTDLGVASPTSGLGSAVANGGDLTVRAGGSIAGGTYFLGRGDGLLAANGAITVGSAFRSGVPTVAPVLGLMDGNWTLRAQRDLELSTVFNPTMMPSANSTFSGGRQRISDNDGRVFFSYGATSSVTASSQAGNLAWRAEQTAAPEMSAYWSQLAANGPTAERIAWGPAFAPALQTLPPQISMAALGGDLRWDVSAVGQTLFPSAQAKLELFAADDLLLRGGAGRSTAVAMSDRLAGDLPSIAQPLRATNNALEDAERQNAFFKVPTSIASVVWGGGHDGDLRPARIHADGDVAFRDSSGGSPVLLALPVALDLSAGGDITNLNLAIQHSDATQVSRIRAGGSVLQDAFSTSSRVTLAGPGRLEIEAGRQVDLGPSLGVESVGAAYNSRLPQAGADLRIAAGLRSTLATDQVDQQEAYRLVTRYLTASAAAVDSTASAFADSWLRATGRDPDALDTAGQALRAQLIDRYATQLRLSGGDAAVVQAHRDLLVTEVRNALALPALPPASSAAAFGDALKAFGTLSRAHQSHIADLILADLFARAYLVDGRPYAAQWQQATTSAKVPSDVYSGRTFEEVRDQVLFAELNLAGGWGSLVPNGARATRNVAYGLGSFAADLSGLGDSRNFAGDIDLVASGLQARNSGSLTLLAPGGQINVGLPSSTPSTNGALRGVVAYVQGNVNAFADGDFQVNSQRVFVVGSGNITIWSARANIDAGRGANTAVTIPPLVAQRETLDGTIAFKLPSLTVGSGIGILKPATGDAQGDIGLYAPNGEVLALDAQIRAPGRITLGAEVVRGADNISGGSVVGAAVPVPTVAVSVPPQAAPAAQLAPTAAGGTGDRAGARERNSLLSLELLGLGAETSADACLQDESEEACRQRRQRAQTPPR